MNKPQLPASSSQLPASRVRLTVTVFAEADCEQAIKFFCKDHLEAKGYAVTGPGVEEWEPAGKFCERVGIYSHRLNSFLARYALRGGPAPILERVGKSQRIAAIKSNAAFDTFCRQHARGPRIK